MPKNTLFENTLPKTLMAEEASQPRRCRYKRSPLETSLTSLTPVRVKILRYLAELRFLSLPQIARLCCPSERQDLSEKNTRRHMRVLFDAGLVDALPVSRAALAPPHAPNDASLLYGSAPNVYVPTTQALKLLCRLGLIDEELLKRPAPAYGPRNSLFLAHELAVRDARVWLEEVARNGRYNLDRWYDGEAAAINLGQNRVLLQSPFLLRPDAWFVLQVHEAVLVGLLEVDRGTERGERHWQEKLDAYTTLFATGCLKRATGYQNARILVLTPDQKRRDHLAALITKHAESISVRFWLTIWDAPNTPNLTRAAWRRPGSEALHSLL